MGSFYASATKSQATKCCLYKPREGGQQSFGSVMMSLGRCSDCEDDNRVINFSVQQMSYHMFFSSAQYTDYI